VGGGGLDGDDEWGVGCQVGVGGEEVERLGDGLGDEEPVEGVVVKKRQPAARNRMAIRNLKFHQPGCIQLVRDDLRIFLDLPQPPLDSNLPDARRGDVHLRGLRDLGPGVSIQTRILLHEPEQTMRIEQHFHGCRALLL